jgi:uncharacterized protein
VSDVLPAIDAWNEAFWRGGCDGHLHIFRCSACAFFVHPPAPVCPSCYGRSVGPVAVSGRGTVYAFTVNHQQWGGRAASEPYVVALVELDEQAELRLLTNVVGCPPEAVRTGMAVTVRFLPRDDVYLPVFAPVDIDIDADADVDPAP